MRTIRSDWAIDTVMRGRVPVRKSIMPARDIAKNTPYCALYVIRPETTDAVVKIGVARNLRSRLRGLQCSNHMELSVAKCLMVKSKEIAHEIEGKAKQILNEGGANLRGEWYQTTVERAYEVLAFSAELLDHRAVEISRAGIDRLLNLRYRS